MTRFFKNIIVASLLLVGACGGVLYYFMAMTPASTQELRNSGPEKIVLIPRRTGLRGLVRIFDQDGFLKYPKLFYYGARVKGLTTKIQAGEFRLKTNSSMFDLYHAIQFSKPVTYKVVIPEGYNMFQVADLLVAKKLIGSRDELIDYITSQGVLSKYGLSGTKAVSLEGYLFPNTYEFTKLDDIPRIVSTLVISFRRKFHPNWEERAKKIGFTTHEIVVLASVIEKETSVGSERSRISSVFHNRLKRGMKLQSDPTTIYGIKNFDGNLRRKHLREWTPYNTYRIKGLPQGPIANPGTDAIRAALFPDKSKYYYFVARNNGTHHFSPTYKEHNRAVIWYQKMRKKGRLPKVIPNKKRRRRKKG